MIFFGKPKNSEDLLYQGVSFLGKNQPKAAIALFNQALKADPKNTSALYNKGQALNQIRKYQDVLWLLHVVVIYHKELLYWPFRPLVRVIA